MVIEEFRPTERRQMGDVHSLRLSRFTHDGDNDRHGLIDDWQQMMIDTLKWNSHASSRLEASQFVGPSAHPRGYFGRQRHHFEIDGEQMN